MGLELGQSASVTRSYTRQDLDAYRELGGNSSAADTVPEPLINALYSYLLGVELPGQGTNYLKQESEFLATAAVGDTLTATVEITRLRPEKHLVDLRTTCSSSDGTLLSDGRALVYVEDVAS